MYNNTAADPERGYTITRVFDAPRELLWQCWTQAEHFAVWFGGDLEMKDMVCDARVGGDWGGTLVLPDGNEMVWFGEFLEVDEPNRLVLALGDVGDHNPDREHELYTVTFTDLGGKTEVVVRQSGGHLDDAGYAGAEHGTGVFLDTLATHVAALQDLGEVVITRIFSAPPEVIWDAFMDPAQLSRFWGPIGVSTPVESIVIEPRVGGRFETLMVADDGSGSFPTEGVFTVFDRPTRWGWIMPGGMDSTTTLKDLGDGRTECTIRQTKVPPAYRSPENLAGFETSLDKLEAYLLAR
jgi:uncharacterized protein YndB with AHSA1/START domain